MYANIKVNVYDREQTNCLYFKLVNPLKVKHYTFSHFHHAESIYVPIYFFSDIFWFQKFTHPFAWQSEVDRHREAMIYSVKFIVYTAPIEDRQSMATSNGINRKLPSLSNDDDHRRPRILGKPSRPLCRRRVALYGCKCKQRNHAK